MHVLQLTHSPVCPRSPVPGVALRHYGVVEWPAAGLRSSASDLVSVVMKNPCDHMFI